MPKMLKAASKIVKAGRLLGQRAKRAPRSGGGRIARPRSAPRTARLRRAIQGIRKRR